MPCLDVIYTPGPTNNPGPPPKPPSGAAP
jgi:hypothetical protein